MAIAIQEVFHQRQETVNVPQRPGLFKYALGSAESGYWPGTEGKPGTTIVRPGGSAA